MNNPEEIHNSKPASIRMTGSVIYLLLWQAPTIANKDHSYLEMVAHTESIKT